jgi:iron complex outermembrane receptor protein
VCLCIAVTLLAAPMVVFAQQGGLAGAAIDNGPVSGSNADTAATLEEVTVTAPLENGQSLGGGTVTQSQMREFDRNSLDSAFDLASGTSVSEVGARNETDIWIRGFDRWRVPIYQDGIPIYLPYDDRIDFGRFTTMDIAQLQIAKGYASVIDGPGAMGGEINLVSRVVTQPLEVEGRLGTTLDSTGAYQGTTDDVFVGSRQSNWYLQGAGSFDKQNYFRLPDDFTPGTLQGSGDRLQSQSEDYKINLKAGYLPNQGADYSVNVIDQIGQKGNPPPDGYIPPSALNTVKYWTWPAWNYQSAYWLSQNALDDRGSYLKTRAYYERFYNSLDSYDSLAYTTQNTPKSFDSTYDDRSAGSIVEFDETLPGGTDSIRASVQYRWDQHNETEATRNTPTAPKYEEPWETAEEATTSLALENVYHPADRWSVTAGASYDYRHLIGDSEWVSGGAAPPFGYSYAYPVANKDALNGELAIERQYSDSGAVHFTYADRARFPTLFEMYSTRFSSFVNNPDLQPERSHYGQAGVVDTLAGTHVVANVFLVRVDHAIDAVGISPTVSEDKNVGVEHREGYEVEVSRNFLAALSAGINYSDLVRVVQAGGVVPTDTPAHKLFAYVDWRPASNWQIVPSINSESRRWLQSAVNTLLYYQGGAFTRVDMKVSYEPLPKVELEIGVTNLANENYEIEDGYHAPGREYFANVRASL